MEHMRKIGEITVHEVGQPTYEGERSHGERRPFFFLPGRQVLLLGAPGGDHWNMVAHDPVAKRFKKEVFDDDATAYGGLYRTPSGENVVEFYRGTPDSEHIPAITQALGANRTQLNEWHVGDEVHDNPDASWHWDFQSRVAKNDEKWQLKMAMPVSEDFWHKWQQSPHNPFSHPGEPTGSLYHGTSPSRLESIMQHGIHPWDSPIAGGTVYKDMPWLEPRPGHVYLSQDPYKARDRGLDSTVEEGANEPIVLRIDPTYLDPQHINPDEDNMPGINDLRNDYPSSGHAAEKFGWGDSPSDTEREMGRGRNIAYRGVIPPEAITPGTYATGEWRPLAWPRTSAYHPWQMGEWGKGIYYPETGVLQTWGDDRTHMDVWGDDENYSQPGSAHHIVIRPNGTVHDQGSFARDFSDAESDVVGLQQALKELDPNLHLDAPSEWSFGPTEPMEEEPSSVSRGEEGGQIHDVQTANDFAGSL